MALKSSFFIAYWVWMLTRSRNAIDVKMSSITISHTPLFINIHITIKTMHSQSVGCFEGVDKNKRDDNCQRDN